MENNINGLSVKREIVNYKIKDPAEYPALLSGFVRSCMSLSMPSGGRMMLELDCQVGFVREFIAANMLREYKVAPRSGGNTLRYDDCRKLLTLLSVISPAEDGIELNGIPQKFYKYDSAYARGVFLGCGSCHAKDGSGSDTGSGGYHLEFSFINEGLADEFTELLARHDIVMHRMTRADKQVVYAKDSENMSNCLALMHADRSVIKLADTVVTLSIKKAVNRKNNCDLANITRSAVAAVDVTDAIDVIRAAAGLDSLPPKLLEAAEARLNSPNSPLAELAFELNISKSGLKHRYDKIIQIARQYKGEKN